MKSEWKRFYILMILSSVMVLPAAMLQAGEWQAGFAKVVITPDSPVWLSGYSSRDHAAEGKVHELMAKAAAFQAEDGTRFVLVTCDLGSMSPEIYDFVAARVKEKHGLEKKSLVINVSHTHCAPEICAERRVFHDLSDEADQALQDYIDGQLKPKLVHLVGQSLEKLSAVEISLGQSAAFFGKSRRFPTENGDFVNQRFDEGVTDNTVPVMRVTTPEGKVVGVLFGYPCHNTTLAFYQYCGDYAGFAQYNIEDALPEATAMFVMGCGGDQNPYPRHGPNGLNYCKQHGRELADAVLTALKGPQLPVNEGLKVARTDVSLKLEPLPPVEKLKKQAEEGNKTIYSRKANYLLGQLEKEGSIELVQNCPLNVARFGNDLLFVFVSGETVLDYARRSQFEFGGQMVWVAGYNNDVFAYLPSQRVLIEGGYEGRTGIVHQLTPTPFLPEVEETVFSGIRKIVGEVTSKSN